MSDGVTILRGIVGSVAYGLDHAGSDVDRLGAFVAPTIQFHGLHSPAVSRVTTTPSDFTEHEVGKYLSLLLKCNPTVTELLWLPEGLYEVVSPEGLALIGLREKFLGAAHIRNAYLGYATQQFKKLLDRGGTFSSDTKKRTEKHARHLMRLCWQGLTLYRWGWLPITVPDPEQYHAFGSACAKDPSVARDLIRYYENMFDTAASCLPEYPDPTFAEEWLVNVRAHHYDGPVYVCGTARNNRNRTPEERATDYLTDLIRRGLVGYHSITECQNAIAKLTTTFEVTYEARSSC